MRRPGQWSVGNKGMYSGKPNAPHLDDSQRHTARTATVGRHLYDPAQSDDCSKNRQICGGEAGALLPSSEKSSMVIKDKDVEVFGCR